MVKVFLACRDRKRPGWVSGISQIAGPDWACSRCLRLRRGHKANAAEVSSRPAPRFGPVARAGGGSGVRKITEARLPMHLSDPQEGAIDAGFRLAGLISVVFLKVCLCNDTVAANIRMARSAAREAGLRTSVDTAHSKGREAAPGDIGGRLEGGERQRVEIAPASEGRADHDP
ncbi:ABC transporter permease (plasmid) [Rhodovulum sulfidophilum]|uniref:ABC transporter permease n=1 Tax=Rhodovulum sulfidophilum TaxID=35806 RepID=A0A0D6B9Q5_RHOSU|nr:ABC transporter permease [Rhodovulum sulfidophilum]